MKRLGTVGTVLGALVVMLLVAGGVPTALAGGDGGGEAEGGVVVKGTGNRLENGRAMWVDVFITCPKPQTWTVDQGGAVFEPTAGPGNQGLLSVADGQGGKCKGKTQATKIKYELFSNVTLRETFPCTLAYDLTVTFHNGAATSSLHISYAPGSESNGPEVCLNGGVGAFPS